MIYVSSTGHFLLGVIYIFPNRWDLTDSQTIYCTEVFQSAEFTGGPPLSASAKNYSIKTDGDRKEKEYLYAPFIIHVLGSAYACLWVNIHIFGWLLNYSFINDKHQKNARGSYYALQSLLVLITQVLYL